MNKAYNAIDWKNEPNTSTPINETNLNKMDRAIDAIDGRVIDLDDRKVNKEEGKSLVSNTEIAKIKTNENAIQTHTLDKSNPHSVTKEQVGLGNVDNTSDVNKPISTAQQEEFDAINSNLANQKKISFVAGDISWAGAELADNNWKRCAYIKVTPNATYTIKRSQTQILNVIGFKNDKTVITDGTVSSNKSSLVDGSALTEVTFTTTATTEYVRIAIRDNNLSENITLSNDGIGQTVVDLVDDADKLKNDLSEIHDLAIGANFSGVAKYVKIGKCICCHINLYATSDTKPYGDILNGLPAPITDVTFYNENGLRVYVSRGNRWFSCGSTVPKDTIIQSYINYIAQ